MNKILPMRAVTRRLPAGNYNILGRYIISAEIAHCDQTQTGAISYIIYALGTQWLSTLQKKKKNFWALCMMCASLVYLLNLFFPVQPTAHKRGLCLNNITSYLLNLIRYAPKSDT